MKRREFVNTGIIASLGLSLGVRSKAANNINPETESLRGVFSLDNNRVRIQTNADVKQTNIFHITDTHLSMDDYRGLLFKKYSERMGKAYAANIQFQTGETITTKESFEQTLALAKDEGADLIALTGDIFSFPSEAAIDWAYNKLQETGVPFVYIAGNHDWHYEGMKGSLQSLREKWTRKRLKPMYQGQHPLYAAYDINGIRIVTIDNSTYEILPDQLNFFREKALSNLPVILLMHIPLYVPGRTMGFGCGNPNWGEKSDKGFEIERREKWRKGGHTETTMSFVDEVFNCSNLLAVFTGHLHRQYLDIKNGLPQLVSAANTTGAYSKITVSSLNQ